MRALPTGTVTLLFTDIEGSTRLLRKLGSDYATALAEHRAVLRDAVAAHGGVEVDTQGDAFLVAFAGAGDAAAAAEQAQQALAAGPVRVRMGLHTGEPAVTDEGYVGLDVHRGARVAAAAHGGQILLTQATRELIDRPVRELGRDRLKDFDEAVALFQLGGDEFPPPRTLHRLVLPPRWTPLVGRERELVELAARLGAQRLVTLTGPGVRQDQAGAGVRDARRRRVRRRGLLRSPGGRARA
jgi:class 3 adenylate cyclase